MSVVSSMRFLMRAFFMPLGTISSFMLLLWLLLLLLLLLCLGRYKSIYT
jgi:hypothetical protein